MYRISRAPKKRRQSRMSKMKQRVSQDANEMEGRALDFDLESISREFPMETLWYNMVNIILILLKR